MAESRGMAPATETVEMPKSSALPAVFALGILGLLAGTFAAGFMFPIWVYAAVGAVLAVTTLCVMSRRGRRAFYSLPRSTAAEAVTPPGESI